MRFRKSFLFALLGVGLLAGSAAEARPALERDPKLLRALGQQKAAICHALQRRGIRPQPCRLPEQAIPTAIKGKLVLPIAPGYTVVCQKGNSPPLAPDSHQGGLRYALDLSEGRTSRPIPLIAPANGTAYVYDGARVNKPDNWGFGNMVVIDHHNGYASLLCHLEGINVRNGTEVRQGQRVGTLGTTGNAGNAHLHFQVSELLRKPNPAREKNHGATASTPPPPFGSSVPVDLGVRALSSGYKGQLDSRFFVGGAGGGAWDIAHHYQTR